MKVLTIYGTRPEFIRLSRVIPKLDDLCEHVVVHTGQNYDPTLNEVFFQELGLRKPDHYLNAHGTFGEQISVILSKMEVILKQERPDRFLVLGDTNSSLAAIVAKRLGIPVYHMEAGNRCYDDRVPEEVNRRIIDHSSDILMPYTERSRLNLLSEGIPGRRIYVTGNPIYEVIQNYEHLISQSLILSSLKLTRQQYFLVTMHREENVDVPGRLNSLVDSLEKISEEYHLPVIVSTHPRTRKRLVESAYPFEHARVRFSDPFGFFDFIALERNAMCVLSDSGTVQEECSIFRVPNVTIRDTTERPETIECGSNIITGVEPDSILRAVKTVLRVNRAWPAPKEYLTKDVSSTVVKILLGFR